MSESVKMMSDVERFGLFGTALAYDIVNICDKLYHVSIGASADTPY